ncbi:MAG: DNA cytosine methyltransferase, partial [Candidatus Nanohalobium sp.]
MDGRPTAIDLFAGAGGITQGLKEAGYRILFAIDNNNEAKLTFDANHTEANGSEDLTLTLEDITEFDPAETGLEPGDVDLVAGGPPCPTFSLVGRSKINSIEGRNSAEDDRHQLYEDFLKFVDYFQPD